MSSKTVVVIQSNYIPWKGYFDLLARADVCVLFDDVQYTRRDWRNRNKIKTRDGLKWLSVPVKVKGRFHQTIRETMVSDPSWNQAHWEALRHSYRKAPCWDHASSLLEPLYLECGETQLSLINRRFLEAIMSELGIQTELLWSWDLEARGGRGERILSICRELGATEYVSGPAAKVYLDREAYLEAGVEVSWISYEGYEEYPQLHGPFVHEVSVVDLLFNTGPEARRYLKSS